MSRTKRSGYHLECEPGYKEWKWDSTRDKKKPYKPDKAYKKMKKKIEKAKIKDADRKGRETPRLYKTNVWDWN